MNKAILILMGVCLALALVVIISAAHKRITTKPEKFVNEMFITVKIDGQEYLWGHFQTGNVLVPKTRKCSCDTIK